MINLKIELFFMLGWVCAAIGMLFEKYIFADWEFFIFISILVIIDFIMAVYGAWKRKAISSSKFSKIINKMLIYSLVLIATHAISHFKIGGKDLMILNWVQIGIYTSMMVREFLSILENAGALGFIVPKFFLKRFEAFDETGEFIEKK